MSTRQLYEAMLRLYTTAHAVGRKGSNSTTIPSGYSLGGTPLCETAAILRYLVPEFQQATKTQIMNVMVLTDGEDTQGLYSTDRKGSFTMGHPSVLRDDTTKYQVAISDRENEPRTPLQRILELVRETTKCNLIGFYLVPKRSAHNMIQGLSYGYVNQNSVAKELCAQFDKHGFVDIKGTGYDSYFVVPSDELDKVVELKDFVDKTQSEGQIANSYINVLSSRRANRIFLGRLIEAVSKDHSEKNIREYRKTHA
jgi:hypothetical protein